jgi:hypothetical protein
VRDEVRDDLRRRVRLRGELVGAFAVLGRVALDELEVAGYLAPEYQAAPTTVPCGAGPATLYISGALRPLPPIMCALMPSLPACWMILVASGKSAPIAMTSGCFDSMRVSARRSLYP